MKKRRLKNRRPASLLACLSEGLIFSQSFAFYRQFHSFFDFPILKHQITQFGQFRRLSFPGPASLLMTDTFVAYVPPHPALCSVQTPIISHGTLSRTGLRNPQEAVIQAATTDQSVIQKLTYPFWQITPVDRTVYVSDHVRNSQGGERAPGALLGRGEREPL